jgi:flagellar biosynthesis/type III secretory pathway protein FliH
MTRVIRSRGSHVISHAALDEEREKGGTVARAEDVARAMVERARAASDAVLRRADERGYAEGLARGHADGVAHALRVLGAHEPDRATHRIALLAAAEIVGDLLEQDPQRIEAIVAAALARAGRSAAVAVTLHPDDAGALGAVAGVEVRTDPAFSRGSVVVEGRAGRVDGRLEVRLSALERALERVRSENFVK